MKFIYTRIKDEIRIDQIEDPEAVIYVPEQFEDCPVTELGSYVLAHSAVEEIHLPPYVRKIGAYGFYECEQLKRIYCYSRVLDLGAGLFAGVPAWAMKLIIEPEQLQEEAGTKPDGAQSLQQSLENPAEHAEIERQ